MIEGLSLPNGGSASLDQVPVLPMETFREFVLQGVDEGGRISSLFGTQHGSGVRLFAVLAFRDTGLLAVASADVGESYPSITTECEQAHMFEREIAEQWNVTPTGHPWLKPVRFEKARRAGAVASGPRTCGVMNFFSIHGEETHEVAVGPVHAGIIEPGHFRFQCHGETIYHLEISLGYQHRGIERALVGGPGVRTLAYMETLAGDTTVAHTMAYCRAVEALGKTRVPARAQVIRGIAQELERIANHIGDLGALAGDVGFLPTQSYCGRIRGDVLNLTAMLCGNRFGRGLIRPGGIGYDIDGQMVSAIKAGLDSAMLDAKRAVRMLWNTPSVLGRFECSGVLSEETVRTLGLVGVVARASGVQQDVRLDFPYGIFRLSHIPVVTLNTGDVFARAIVRWQEAQRSAVFITEQLDSLPESAVTGKPNQPGACRIAVAMVEGWRGEICHVAITDAAGKLSHYKVVDPSFHNWYGLANALRNQQISDFPMCNKSFNLSYCGFDL